MFSRGDIIQEKTRGTKYKVRTVNYENAYLSCIELKSQTVVRFEFRHIGNIVSFVLLDASGYK
jgi:hypothetical protein